MKTWSNVVSPTRERVRQLSRGHSRDTMDALRSARQDQQKAESELAAA